MKWTMRYAALLAALVLSLGLVSIMRPGAAAADSDEVMLRPPGDRGDPDDGGPSRALGINRTSSFVSVTRVLSFFRASRAGRTSHESLRVSSASRQRWAPRR